jgi:integrase
LLSQELEFIGKKYIKETPEKTEEAKQKILRSYDKYQLAKITWLNNVYEDDITKKPLWSVYKNNIHDFEVAKQKDLKFFTHDEMKSMLNSFIYAMDTTKRTLIVFVNQYCEYFVGKDISINPCTGISFAKTAKTSKKLLQTKVYGMDDFYELLTKMKYKTKGDNIKPLLLARYGIIGKQAMFMRTLKWNDIDTEHLIVNIRDDNGEIIREIPIDRRFVEFLVELEEQKVNEGEEFNILKSDAYVLGSGAITKYATMNSRIYNACNSLNKDLKEGEEKQDRINISDLLFTRQLEMLLNIRKERKVRTDDIENILQLFYESNVSQSVAINFKTRYESLTGDKVVNRLRINKKSKNYNDANREALYLVDLDAEKTVKDICKNIGLTIE